jgi:hypothetical protein
MSEPGSICPQCAANVPAGVRFCGNCGASIDAPAAAPAKPAMKTMLGLDADAVRAATEALRIARAQPGAQAAPAETKPVSEQARRALNQTMLGFAADLPRPAGAAPTPAEAPRPQPTAAATRTGGQPAGASPRGTWSDAPGPALPAQPKTISNTVLGLSALTPSAASAQVPPGAKTVVGTQLGMSAPTPSAAEAQAPGPAQFGTTKTAGTMLGMSAPLPTSPSQPPPEGRSAGHGRTMLGVPLASLMPPGAKPGDPPPAAAEHAEPAPVYAENAWSGEAEASAGSEPRASYAPPPERSKPWWPMALGVLALAALAGMLLVRLTSHPQQTDVTARIISAETGESLLFEVPGAPAGSRLRFGGQEQPLNAGRASFPLAADSLRVGDNVVLADVVKPNGDTTSARITLAVFYRVWVDTAALRADRSALDVIVTALPGTHVTLEGEELKLDAQGRATRSFPLDVVHQAKGGIIDHVVHYRMQPPSGETVVDELHTKIPVAMMQIDRPGIDVVTDRESIEIAGAVGRDTQVRVDGHEVPVKDQRFLYRFALPKPGDYQPRVVASAAGKAPLGVNLHIRRVRDLVQAAREFVPDANLTYAKLAPNPNIYRGQSIALEGRVYAFDARAGSSVIQMLVRPCPSSQRCSLWVVDPQASEVAVDHWVRVLGTVDGEQQFRSEKNEVVTVPKIVARFILPAKP